MAAPSRGHRRDVHPDVWRGRCGYRHREIPFSVMGQSASVAAPERDRLITSAASVLMTSVSRNSVSAAASR